jgi:putative transposase
VPQPVQGNRRQPRGRNQFANRQVTRSGANGLPARVVNTNPDCQGRFLIRDRDGKFPALFDAILTDAGIETVLSGVRMPRMNSIMERWGQACRRELLDRTLIWNQPHLLHALREFEQFCNEHRPHQGIANARPLQLLPVPLTAPDQIASLHIRRRDRLGGVFREYLHAA